MRLAYSQLDQYNFDFIGDVHGCFEKLCDLLEKMGYTKDDDGVYFHSNTKAFFLGDIVDGGPEVVKTFLMVKAMVEKGYAFMIMGNHEINLLAINTKSGSSWLRERSNSKLKQCVKSLDLLFSPEVKDHMNFIKSLPFYVETKNFRAVHACWDKPSISILDQLLNPDKTISQNEFELMFLNKGGFAYDAMEKVLKGLEVHLPDSQVYTDKYGKKRDHARFIWWDKNQDLEIPTNGSIAIPYDKYSDPKIVLFGHYWRKGTPLVNDPYTLCLDYSAMANGVLTAYRYSSGDTTLFPDKILFL